MSFAFKIDIDNLVNNSRNFSEKLTSLTNDYNSTNREKDKINYDLNLKRKEFFDVKNKIDVLETNLSNMNKIPYSVRAIIDNPTLRGIHNILGNVVDTKDEYVAMLEVSLGASMNNIITEDEACAKEAIEYLKRHNKGRATFFPLNVIKPKSVDPETLRSIQNIIGFVGIASDLVTYDS